MRDRNCWVLRLVLCTCMSWPTFSAAQEHPVPQDSSVGPLSAKELKKRDKEFMKELNLDDSNWLLNEVPDIITEAERRAFLELGTEEEREQFKEIFWRDRNPAHDSPINPVREEHYRRLRRRTLRLRHSRPENGPRPHLHHLGRAMRSSRILVAAPTNVLPSKAVASPLPMLGSCGAIAIWKVSAKT